MPVRAARDRHITTEEHGDKSGGGLHQVLASEASAWPAAWRGRRRAASSSRGKAFGECRLDRAGAHANLAGAPRAATSVRPVAYLPRAATRPHARGPAASECRADTTQTAHAAATRGPPPPALGEMTSHMPLPLCVCMSHLARTHAPPDGSAARCSVLPAPCRGSTFYTGSSCVSSSKRLRIVLLGR
jgi:hypothetical protein